MFLNLLALKLEYAMSVYQKFRDCKTAAPFLCPRMRVPFLWSTIYPAINFVKKEKKIGHLELVHSSISPFLVLPSIRRYRIEYMALYAVLATKYLFHADNWLSYGSPK